MSDEYTGINRIFHSEALQDIKNRSGDGMFRELYRDWKWIFAFAWNRKGYVILYTFLGLAISSLSLFVSYMSKMLINTVVTNEYRNFVLVAAAYGIGITLNIAVNAILSRLSAKINIYINNDIQESVFAKVIDANWSDVAKYKTGDLLNRFNSDVGTIAANAVNWIPNIIINIYTFVITFVVLWKMDIKMAVISLSAAPVLLVVSRYFMKRLQEQRKKVSELNSEIMSFENDAFDNYDMIKSFGINDFYNRQLFSWHGKYKDCNLDYNKLSIKANIVMSITSTLVALVAFGYCLYRLSTGQLLYGDMTFFLSQRSNVSSHFNSIMTAFPGLLNSAVSAQRVRELIELSPENHNENSLNELSESKGITVKLNNVAFSYNEAAQIYKGGDFIARPGEIVTILGSSGEGKTTLLRMILGLISPDSGDVTLIGSDGKEIFVNADLRRLISYVPQGNTIISGTIAENMRMVKENATDEEITEALKTACAWDFVKDLPDGINTHLGGNAHGISMGQGQRISIARAVLRDAPILMLDEATSALDSETENTVLKNIVSMCPDKTCIVSTHRPSILKLSSRIYRVEDKKLIQIDNKGM